MGFPGGASGKEPPCQCRRCRFDPWVGQIPWRRKWQPNPVFLPGEFNGRMSLQAPEENIITVKLSYSCVSLRWGTDPAEYCRL